MVTALQQPSYPNSNMDTDNTNEYNKKRKFGDSKTNETIDDENILLDHLNNQTEDPYTVIESYFQGKYLERLVRHQIESYNHFVNYQIQRTISMFNPVKFILKMIMLQKRTSICLEI